MKIKSVFFILLIIITFTLTACMPGDNNFTIEHQAGFFFGIWHGWIAPISLIVSIFDSAVRIYEVNNTGFWYDFGFYIAIISGFGSVSLSRKKIKSSRSRK
ncbi:MAG: hypothetical protein JXA06_10680 [Bacteroidetes bacterium]|nr:hypothetical protein [Bacteroidota bacterium]